MSSICNASKVVCAPSLIQHGLLVGIMLIIVSAAMSLEALEILTGIVGAVAVCLMRESNSRCRKHVSDPVVKPSRSCKISDSSEAFPIRDDEATMQPIFTDEMPLCNQDHLQLSACAHAELNTMRAEGELANWKLKVEKKESDLAHLQAKTVELEKELMQEESSQTQIDAVLMNLAEAKVRVEEAEAELVQSHTNMSQLEKNVADAFSMQMLAEETAQTPIEALSTSLMEANFQWTEEHMEMFWPSELCELSE